MSSHERNSHPQISRGRGSSSRPPSRLWHHNNGRDIDRGRGHGYTPGPGQGYTAPGPGRGHGYTHGCYRGTRGGHGYNRVYGTQHPYGCQNQGTWTWMPIVAQWEKDFCTQVGNISWDDFSENKQNCSMILHRKVFNWDDSAGQGAFNNSKHKFWASLHGHPYNDTADYNPDLYSDNVDWKAHEDWARYVDVEEAQQHKHDDNISAHNEAQDLPLAPTGWDVDIIDPYGPNYLTGLIVGEDWSSGSSHSLGVEDRQG